MIRRFQALKTEAGLDFDVAFDPERRFHCLVGVNGVGKTHLIEHLARTFLYAHTMFDLQKGGQRYTDLFQIAVVNTALSELDLRMAVEVSVDETTIKDWERERWNTTKLGLVRQTRRDVWHVDRPIVFVGARERGHTRNIEPQQLRLLGSVADQFVAAFLKTWRAATGEPRPVEEPAEWFSARLLINPAFAVGNDPQIEAVVEVLGLLQRLDPKEFASLMTQDGQNRRIDLGYHNGALHFAGRPIDKLATGYISLLKIFQEIVAGYAAWNAMSDAKPPTDLRALDGVVFIDELEAHLHPQWQARIVGILKRSFPNTTFFVTTHSPLVLRQTEPGEAIEILRDDGRVTSRRLGSPRDWYLADVYAEGFHVDIPLPGQDAPEGARPLGGVMLDFSKAVRDYAATRDTAAREGALALHDEVDRRLAQDDSRRRSLTMLRELLG